MKTIKLMIFSLLALSLAACDKNDGIKIDDKPYRSSPQLIDFESCENLEDQLKASLKAEYQTQLLQNLEHRNSYWGSPEVSMAEDTDSAGAAEGGGSNDTRQEGVDFSGTNNPENGVDEADFVKTDGYHIYNLNGKRLEIFAVPQFGELEHVSTTPLEGSPSQMLQHEDSLVVFSSIYAHRLPEGHPLRDVVGQTYNDEYEYYYYRTSLLTKITVLDIADRTNPSVTRELYIEGRYNTARKVGSTVRFLSYAWMNIPGLRTWPELPNEYYEHDWNSDERHALYETAVYETIAKNNVLINNTPLRTFLAQIYERQDDILLEHTFNNGACENFAIAEDGLGRGVNSILSLDLLGDNFSFDADHILSNRSTVYASKDVLILAEPSNDWWWFWRNPDFEEATNIHRFDISDGATTVYTGSGRVPGVILDQFSLSEYEGNIRVASTVGRWNRWWEDDPSEPNNHVFVLNGTDSLNVVGSIGDIAIGEQIWSSRFKGEKGYLVTFENIDPLWTIDLSNPTSPTLEGELEVPGVSTYIHPIADGRLLTIGYGGDDNGLDWSTQVSLFDVSDFQNPTLQQAYPVNKPEGDNWTWTWSEATWEHKAFQYWEPKKLLAIPVSTYRWVYANNNENGESGEDSSSSYYSHYEYYSRLELISVDTTTGISSYGAIDHSDYFNSETSYYWSRRDVRRSIFMGDYIYAISDRGLTVHNLDDIAAGPTTTVPEVAITMTGSVNEDYWGW
ncbi:MAG: beta-propeller domain-containing protein [Myxococcota bacterium]|nr:beta-propeller domain-containing protein [Myxococcota bacterium]